MRHATLVLTCFLVAVFSVKTIGQKPITSTPNPIVLDAKTQRHQLSPDGFQQQYIFEKLLPNELYSLTFPDFDKADGCLPTVSCLDAEVKWAPESGGSRFYFTPKAAKMRIMIEYCSDKPLPKNHWMSLVLESKKTTNLKDFLAVLQVEGGYSAEDLVRDVIIGGDCFDITNVTYVGSGAQIGKFSSGATSVGLAEGAILCTGDINEAPGPNSGNGTGISMGGGTQDGDLIQLAGGGSTFDLCDIEFDFQPTETPLTFKYVFASEEYCEYVNSTFNDRFGFFISGPGLGGPFSGASNLAVIPMTGTYVGINTVNHLMNTGFFKNNLPAGMNNCTPLPDAGASANELEFDGLTVPLVATANVIPCSTYHIKLKIADVGDGIFDSAVFLGSGSFDAGGNASVELAVNGDPTKDHAIEGCDNATFTFTRVGTALSSPVTVQYVISGTATNGVDYSPIANTITIPAGQTSVTLNINVIADLLNEPVENLRLKLIHPCSCQSPFYDLFIEDYMPMTIMTDTIEQCGPGVVTIEPTVTGGSEPYMFQWSTGQSGPSISTMVNNSTNIYVTVTDACGKKKTKATYVHVYPPPMATTGGTAFLCEGGSGTATIVVTFKNKGPWNLIYSHNGVIQDPIEGITVTPYNLIVSEPGSYALIDCTNEDGCDGSAVGAVNVFAVSMAVTGIITNVACNGGNTGAINTTVTGGAPNFTYKWTPSSAGMVEDPINLTAGTYVVTVTDSHQCTTSKSFTVTESAAMILNTTNIIGTNCAAPNGGSATVVPSGGTAPYNYSWSNSQVGNPLSNVVMGNYTATVTDNNGCTKTVTASIPGDFAPPIANATANGQITCQIQQVPLSGAGSDTGPNISYQWTTAGGAFVGPTNQQDATAASPGDYTIVVTNGTNGCTASKTLTVPGSSDIPDAVASAPDPLTCTTTVVDLYGTGTASGIGISYLWSGPGLLGDPTFLNQQANLPGTYTLVVNNSLTGCSKTSQVVVDLLDQKPNAQASTPDILNCTNSQLILSGNGSSVGNNFAYQWTTNGGNISANATTLLPTITLPGSYQILVTNTATGCTNTASVNVVQNLTTPTAAIAQPAVLNCTTNQIPLDASGSTSGSGVDILWTTANGNFISGTNSLNPIINLPGNYLLTLTNQTSNCTATATTTVSQNTTIPPVNAGQPTTLNCNILTATLGQLPPTNYPNLTYDWSGQSFVSGQTTANPVVNEQGSYYLTVTDSQNGCSASASVVISQNIAPPTASAAPGGQLTCQSTSIALDGGASSFGPAFTYLWTTQNGSIQSGAMTQSPTVTSAGDYMLVVTDNTNGCTASTVTTVTKSANLPIAVAVPDGILSCKKTTVTLDATGSTEGPDITYQWQTVNGNLNGNTTSTVASVDQPGDYVLLVTNTSNNCQTAFSVNVQQDIVNPTANAGPGGQFSCSVQSINLNGGQSSQGPNFTYEWTTMGGSFSPSSDLKSLTPTAAAAGTYTILVTNETNGCTASANVVLTQAPDVPVATIAAPATLTCSVQTLNLSGAGSSSGAAYSYKWTTTNGLITAGSTTLNPTISLPGTYQLAVTDNVKGCTTLSSVVVGQDIAAPQISAGPNGLLTCLNQQTTLTGSVTSPANQFSYAWSTLDGQFVSGQTTATPIVSKAGTYTLTVQNLVNGCTTAASTTVITNTTPPVAVIAAPPVLTCTTLTAPLDATGSSTGQFTYAWTTTNGQIISQTDPIHPTVGKPGTYTLLITSNVNGCTATTSTTVTQNIQPPTAVVAAGGELNCTVLTLNLNGTGSSTGANFTYKWTTTGGAFQGSTTVISPTVTKPGTYLLTVKDSQNGCTTQAQTTVTQNINPPSVIVGTPSDLTCVNKTTVLSGTGSASGPTISYLWTTQNGQITAGSTTLTPTVSKAGLYTFTSTNSANGCSATAQVTVNENITPPTADAGNPFELTCANPTTTLQGTASPQTTVVWTTIGGHILSGTTALNPSVDKGGIYKITATSLQNGCTASDEVTISENNNKPSDLAITLKVPGCSGTDGQITIASVTGGVGPYLYSINGGQTWLTTTDFKGIVPGTYDLFVQDVNGCEYHESLVVPAPAKPTLTIVPQIQIDLGDSLTLSPTLLPVGFPLAQIDTVIWKPLDGLTFAGNSISDLLYPSAKPLRNTKYTVTVISTAGCTASATTLIKVDRDPHVYIPNAISPWNHDVDNDKLIIFADPAQIVEITAFEMFDRWGDKVYADYGFQPNTPANGWGAIVRDKQLNPGVYVYWAKIKFIDGRSILYKGDVTLVR